MCSACLVVTGTIVGGVTFYAVILGTISGAGSFLKTFSEIKDYEKKIECVNLLTQHVKKCESIYELR